MVKVKICGITNIEDALAAQDAGADALGFLFYKESRRNIAPQKAKEIIVCLPKDILKVGVFVDGKEKDIRWAADLCGFNLLQFHGDESPEFCAKFSDYKIIKAFRIRRKRDVRNIFRYDVYAYLFDTYIRLKAGGTGEKFDWDLVKDVNEDGGKRIIFLSGGLNSYNVRQAIKVVRPDWVDVSSSVEITPGKKDHKKIREFIKAAKGE